MVNLAQQQTQEAQAWLNNNFPNFHQRTNILELQIFPSSWQNEPSIQHTYPNAFYVSNVLIGELNLTDFIDLKKLIIREQGITGLNLKECSLLKEVDCRDNLLEFISFPRYMPNLKILFLTNNNLERRSLRCLSNFFSLEFVEIGTKDISRIEQNIYNRWHGSFKHLKDLRKLTGLDISATDLNRGLRFLPNIDGFSYFISGTAGRQNARVAEINQKLEWNEELARGDKDEENETKITSIFNFQLFNNESESESSEEETEESVSSENEAMDGIEREQITQIQVNPNN